MPNSAAGKELQQSLNGPGHKLGFFQSSPLVWLLILCRTQQEVKNFNNFIFNLLNGLEQKLGILTDLSHLSFIYLAALTTQSSQLVKLREELVWCQLGWAMCLPGLETMTGQSRKK